MTPLEQRYAIAEACGWRRLQKNETRANWPVFTKDDKIASAYTDTLPDYLSDLNAMHQAEKALLNAGHYEDNLRFIVRRDNHKPTDPQVWYFHATAAQRAEAFLKTIGKWT